MIFVRGSVCQSGGGGRRRGGDMLVLVLAHASPLHSLPQITIPASQALLPNLNHPLPHLMRPQSPILVIIHVHDDEPPRRCFKRAKTHLPPPARRRRVIEGDGPDGPDRGGGLCRAKSTLLAGKPGMQRMGTGILLDYTCTRDGGSRPSCLLVAATVAGQSLGSVRQ